VLEKERVTAPENLDVEADRLREEGELLEVETNLTGEARRSADQRWSRDIERLDELIDRYLLIAVSADRDFDQAWRAAYVVLELVETKWNLLESYIGGAA
jgi:hypothetical protein